MSTNTGIEWTDATWNPVTGCTRASAGCDQCYAVTMTRRLEMMGQAKYAGLTVLHGWGDRHFNGVVRTHEDALSIPLSWRKPRRVFVNSMSDLFHKGVPFEFIDRVFAVMALCPHHTFQVLTKRPERMAEYLARVEAAATKEEYSTERWLIAEGWNAIAVSDRHQKRYESGYDEGMIGWPLPNVWIGTSVENQAAADERIPHLLRCPARVRFLSCEPLLGPVDLRDCRYEGDLGHNHTVTALSDTYYGGQRCHRVDWVIVGGESGPGARPFDLAWAKSIIGQCRAAGVACFVEQVGAKPENTDPTIRAGGIRDRKGGDWSEWPADLRVREMPATAGVGR